MMCSPGVASHARVGPPATALSGLFSLLEREVYIMRFYLLDRIVAYNQWKSIHAQKLISRNEPFLEGEIFPSALVLEALCQAGSWLLLLSSDLRQRAALLSIGSVGYLRDVAVGAVLEIEGQVESVSAETAVFSGRVLVGAEPVLEAREIMCVLREAQDLEDAADTMLMKRLLLREGYQ